jgi:hypothetical protein
MAKFKIEVLKYYLITFPLLYLKAKQIYGGYILCLAI